MRNKLISSSSYRLKRHSIFVYFPRQGVKEYKVPYAFYRGQVEVRINPGLCRANVLSQTTRFDHQKEVIEYEKKYGTAAATELLREGYPQMIREKRVTTHMINTGFPFYVFNNGKLEAISLPDLMKFVDQDNQFDKTQNSIGQFDEIHLREIDYVYYEILKHLDSSVDSVMISDPHGAANKVFLAMSIFPEADIIYVGDAFDRAENAHGTINFLKTYDTRKMEPENGVYSQTVQVANNHFKGVLGNHDWMVVGAGLGELTSLAHALRFMLRYNEVDYLEKQIGLDLTKAKELALKVNYKGNYKAKDLVSGSADSGIDAYRALEALFTDIQLIMTYGDNNVVLTNDEQVLLENIKYKKEEKVIKDDFLNSLYQKIKTGFELDKEYKARKKIAKNKNEEFIPTQSEVECRLTAEEVAVINRIKKGNNQLPEEYKAMLKDLQLQIIKSAEFRSIVEFAMFHNNSYSLKEIADPDTGKATNIFSIHSHIPLNEDGSFREVEIEGEEGKYKGLALLDKINAIKQEYYQRYLELNVDDKVEVNNFLEWVNKKRVFNWFAWDFNSPAYGRIMQTFERAYLSELSDTYAEPEDVWYKVFQNKNAGSEVVAKVFQQLAEELNVNKETLHIINGHKPNKKGFMEIFHDGKVIRIDAGLSSAYGDHGIVTLVTKKGTFYSVSLSNDPQKRFSVFKVINGQLIDVTRED